MVFKNEHQRQEAIRIAKQMFADGKTTSEIAKAMCLSESNVRSLKKSINDS